MSMNKSNKDKLSNILIIILFVCTVLVIGIGIIKDKKDSEKIAQDVAKVNANIEPLEKKVVVTIIDDDGASSFLTNMKPVLDGKNVKASLAIITDKVDSNSYMTKQQLLDLQANGYELLCHTKTHNVSIYKDSLANVSDLAIDEDFKGSHEYMVTNGFKGSDIIVYPWGNFGDQATRYETIAKKYYKYGLNASGTYNTSSSDNMYLDRYPLQKTKDFATTLKPVIDKCIANKGWLILYTHAADSENFSSEYLSQVIDYIQQNKVQILPFSDAAKIKASENKQN